ncbi:TetR/AcrR family transcriptional regulator [Phenylobacterium sp. LjRoot219]|uniref:TetR/AcrR family transcriptional regulator n=1 Tax=Phenylobacterium sp. LjRoot219 TaxID=3342283 RepID=UPI003ECE6E6B
MKRKAAPKPAERRESYHHGDLRRVLLDAAHAEIAAHGAQSLSLSSLARQAGVAQSAPYRHFADREELLAAVATEGFEAFTRAILQAAEAGDEAGALKRMAAAYLRFGEENVELYRLMFASRLVPGSGPDSPLQAAAWASFQPLLERVAAAEPQRSNTAANVRWAQLHGLVMLKADGFLDAPAEDLLAVTAI